MTTSTKPSLIILLFLLKMTNGDEMCRTIYNVNASSSTFDSLSVFGRCFDVADCQEDESITPVASGEYVRVIYTCTTTLSKATMPPSPTENHSIFKDIPTGDIDLGFGLKLPKEAIMAVIVVLSALLCIALVLGFCCCCFPTCLKRTCDVICAKRPNNCIRPDDAQPSNPEPTTTTALV